MLMASLIRSTCFRSELERLVLLSIIGDANLRYISVAKSSCFVNCVHEGGRQPIGRHNWRYLRRCQISDLLIFNGFYLFSYFSFNIEFYCESGMISYSPEVDGWSTRKLIFVSLAVSSKVCQLFRVFPREGIFTRIEDGDVLTLENEYLLSLLIFVLSFPA